MNTYNTICNRASEMYQAARTGDALALAIEHIMVYLSDEKEAGRLDSEDNSIVDPIVDFLADGYGLTFEEVTA